MIPTKIIIHHSLTKDSGTVSWGAIREFHVKENGWNNIGYHAGVELINNHYEILIGRPWDEMGAHTKGYNSDSLGVCLVGNFDEEKPSDAILYSGSQLIKYWMRTFHISVTNVYGHHDFNKDKSCPGTKFDMISFKRAYLI
jgi:hypothetical protein